MVRHRTRARVARLMLGLLLFTQGALAMAGCDWLRAAPALAISASSSQPPCHEAPAVNANLCLAHCLSADQSTDTPQVVVPVWVDSRADHGRRDRPLDRACGGPAVRAAAAFGAAAPHSLSVFPDLILRAS